LDSWLPWLLLRVQRLLERACLQCGSCDGNDRIVLQNPGNMWQGIAAGADVSLGHPSSLGQQILDRKKMFYVYVFVRGVIRESLASTASGRCATNKQCCCNASGFLFHVCQHEDGDNLLQACLWCHSRVPRGRFLNIRKVVPITRVHVHVHSLRNTPV
jgi:hypothetical protein